MTAEMPPVCWFRECDKDSVPAVGGKCASLGELIKAGVRVPPGFAVTTAGYARFLEEGGLRDALLDALEGLDEQDMQALDVVAAEIRARIEKTPFSPALEDLIAECYRKLSLESCLPAAPVAVRSSATAEDLPGASFAGQQDTYLWIRGAGELLTHIRRCFASLYTARSIAYRGRMGFAHDAVAISVGVQKMANSFTAGVLFTLNPASGDRSIIAIDSNFGFGESVVSGEVTPDHFLVNKVSLEILERTISRKELFYTVDPESQSSRSFAMPAERQKVQSIVDEEIVELARMGKRIEAHYGRPMDIEWAIDKDTPAGGNIFILQARPETVWSTKQRESPDGSKSKSAMEHILASVMTGQKVR